MTTMKIKNNTIEITKTFSQKASRVGSPEYYELLKVRQENPSCTVEIKQTKSKDSFKGLTYEYMKKYILAHDDEEGSIMAIFHEMRGTIVEGDDELQAESLTYGEIKMWFLTQYPEIEKMGENVDKILAFTRKVRDEKKNAG